MFRFYLFLLFCVCCSSPTSGVESATDRECADHEFPCQKRGCVLKLKWCDTREDCDDDSDEVYCLRATKYIPNPNKCKSGYFRCSDGPCIPISGRCDGYASCNDHSDEENCTSTLPATSTLNIETESTLAATSTMESTTLLKQTTTSATTTTSKTSPAPSSTSTSTTKRPTLQDHFFLQRPQYTEHVRQPSYSYMFPTRSQRSRDIARFRPYKAKAEAWLLSRNMKDLCWKDTARAVVALYMANPEHFKNKTKDIELLSGKLELRLSLDLIKNNSKEINLNDFSLYINALLATCNNPRNFYGMDLAATLRERTNSAMKHGHAISPIVYLSLCLLNETSNDDLKHIQNVFSTKNSRVNMLENMALGTIAATCIAQLPKYTSTKIHMDCAQRLFRDWSKRGMTSSNIYTAALVAQALSSVEFDGNVWQKTEVMNFILEQQDEEGSFGDVLAAYYVLPLLSGRTLASFQQQHCYVDVDEENGFTPLEVLKNKNSERIYVQYSLHIGDPVELSHTIQLKVAEGMKFLDVMRLAQDVNPTFKFKLDASLNPPAVYSIGGIPNDSERNLYWIPHYFPRKNMNPNNIRNLTQFTDDISKLVLTTGDDFVFWFKPL